MEENDKNLKTLKSYALAVYVLYLLSLIVGLTSIVGFILALIKQGEAKGTPLESHFELQVRSFVWGLVIFLIGLLLSFIGVGLLVMIAGAIWILYLWVVGLIRLLNDQPAPRVPWIG